MLEATSEQVVLFCTKAWKLYLRTIPAVVVTPCVKLVPTEPHEDQVPLLSWDCDIMRLMVPTGFCSVNEIVPLLQTWKGAPNVPAAEALYTFTWVTGEVTKEQFPIPACTLN